MALSLSGLASCGYGVSATPYRLIVPGGTLRLSVPVPENRSRYAQLGPRLSRAVIGNLSGIPGLILENGPSEANLRLTITSVVVGSGSWDVLENRDSDLPETSASRTATVTLEAVLTRPSQKEGVPVSSRRNFASSRTYLVGASQGQAAMQEEEALDWIIEDISQKVALLMFNEF
jgi:hypothetical protein